MDPAGVCACVQTHLDGAPGYLTSLGAQEGEHREHTAMAVGALG